MLPFSKDKSFFLNINVLTINKGKKLTSKHCKFKKIQRMLMFLMSVGVMRVYFQRYI
jgi:hypothetical protein